MLKNTLRTYVAGATLLLTASADGLCQQFLQVTTIESVVPAGLGRSRMITEKPDGSIDEIKLENFFSLTGINFGNVRMNDRLITQQLEQIANEGWHLLHVTPGVYAADKSTGIFITRYLFTRGKPAPEPGSGE